MFLILVMQVIADSPELSEKVYRYELKAGRIYLYRLHEDNLAEHLSNCNDNQDRMNRKGQAKSLSSCWLWKVESHVLEQIEATTGGFSQSCVRGKGRIPRTGLPLFCG